jgi:transcriptional regulator with XRE-family HTH domain
MKTTTTTLANRFKQLREAQELTLEAVAGRANSNRSTIWKIENGKPVSPHTLSQSAKVGLGLAEGSEEYAELVALWVVSRGLSDEPQLNIGKALTRVTKSGGQRLMKDAAKIASAIQPLSLNDQRALTSAIEKPEALSALVALARHFA